MLLFRALLASCILLSIGSYGSDVVINPESLPKVKTRGSIEVVATFNGAMPTGVSVSRDKRIFVNFPRWGDDVPFTVAEIVQGKAVPYPNEAVNREPKVKLEDGFVSVQSVVVDTSDRLWILDTGSPEFKPTQPGGPKLIGIDLKTNAIVQKIVFPRDVALATTYLNDIRFDLKRGKGGVGFITDSSDKGDNAIIVVDLASGTATRRLSGLAALKADNKFVPFVEGNPLYKYQDGARTNLTIGADGIALSLDGQNLFVTPLASRRLLQFSADALADSKSTDADIAKTLVSSDRGFASDGLEIDAQGRIYLTDYEHHAIQRLDPDGSYHTIVCDPRVLWPDTLSIGSDGYLYFINNQLQRQKSFNKEGKDLREKPYTLMRVKLD